MSGTIRDTIVATRKERVQRLGHSEGAAVPLRREAPLVPFLANPGLICEVKKRSPSKGDIAPGMDAVEQAEKYLRAGASNLSILTEQEAFGGGLDDLMRVKKAFPEAAVLRKDFLLDEEDVRVAWRSGADAVLLIAGILDGVMLNAMYRLAKELGMEALVEIHGSADLAKAAALKPTLVGVNSRDLTTFKLDPLLPLRVKSKITWPSRVVYESGIFHSEQAAFAISSGFSGLLVGESVVRNPALVEQFSQAIRTAQPVRFWNRIGAKLAHDSSRPLVKICGITSQEDAKLAVRHGADVLGFVFWEQSPRCANADLLHAIKDIDVLKVGVTVTRMGASTLDAGMRDLLEAGLLDAVQFHGSEPADVCAGMWPTYYKAIKPAMPEEVEAAAEYRCPRVLLDASATVPGGSGERVMDTVLDNWRRPLWLAGGITPENVRQILRERKPELIDIASGVEESPGKKSPDKLRRLFLEIEAESKQPDCSFGDRQ